MRKQSAGSEKVTRAIERDYVIEKNHVMKGKGG